MKNSNKPRFLINPFEIIVFFIVLSLAGTSFYRLFFDWENRQEKGIVSKTEAVGTPSKPHRGLASQKLTLSTLEYKCSLEHLNQFKQNTSAERIRIVGFFCDSANRHPKSILQISKQKFLKIEISNNTNQSKATVFEEIERGKFTTDYILLEPGENKIQVVHLLHNGKKVIDELIITRN